MKDGKGGLSDRGPPRTRWSVPDISDLVGWLVGRSSDMIRWMEGLGGGIFSFLSLSLISLNPISFFFLLGQSQSSRS